MKSTFTVVVSTFKTKSTEVEVKYNPQRESIEFQNGTYLKQKELANLIAGFLQTELEKRDKKMSA